MDDLDIPPTPRGGRADSARVAQYAEASGSWIPASDLAVELGISRRTLSRWLLDEVLVFPRPRCVNHRLYFERGAVETWKSATAIKMAGER
jgi:hypothetical protein